MPVLLCTLYLTVNITIGHNCHMKCRFLREKGDSSKDLRPQKGLSEGAASRNFYFPGHSSPLPKPYPKMQKGFSELS